MSKSLKFKNNNYLDSSSITHNKQQLNDILNKHFFTYEDTSGNEIKEVLRKKMEYGLSLCTQDVETVIFNGGWQGINFGFSIFSKNDSCNQLVWISTIGIFMCRYYNNVYIYKTLSWSDL